MEKSKHLKGVSLEVEQGKIVTILGANGAGKIDYNENHFWFIKTQTWNR